MTDTHNKICCGVAIVSIGLVILMAMKKPKCNCPEKFVPSSYIKTQNLMPESPQKLSTFYGNNAAATMSEDAGIMKTVI